MIVNHGPRNETPRTGLWMDEWNVASTIRIGKNPNLCATYDGIKKMEYRQSHMNSAPRTREGNETTKKKYPVLAYS